MIVKNEEDVLGRALKSVQGIADEIIIVDTGSTDSTKEIASSYTNKIYDLNGVMIFLKLEIILFPKLLKIIVCG